MKKLEERYNIKHTFKNIMELIKLISTILFISHMFACIWIFFGKMTSSSSQITWLDKYELSDKEWYDRYISGYYFSTVTMITVGYGDIVPQNNKEKILCLLTMLIACGVFGYSLNIIGVIINDFFR